MQTRSTPEGTADGSPSGTKTQLFVSRTARGEVKPGDKVYYVGPRAAELVSYGAIEVAVYVGPVPSNPRWPQVRIHLGWIGAEEVSADCLFASESEARAHLSALVKKRLRRLRAEVKRLAALDVANAKMRDRTGQIKKRVLDEIAARGAR
jgi:hypothetical protein